MFDDPPELYASMNYPTKPDELERALGMGEEELLFLPQGDRRKRVVAHRLCEQPRMNLPWLEARLQMGGAGDVRR